MPVINGQPANIHLGKGTIHLFECNIYVGHYSSAAVLVEGMYTNKEAKTKQSGSYGDVCFTTSSKMKALKCRTLGANRHAQC